MGMSKGQIEHLVNRLNTAINLAVDKYESTLAKAVFLTEEEKVEAIKNGKAKFKASKNGRYHYLVDSFTYSEDEKAEKQRCKNEAAVEKFKAPLLKAKAEIIDNAILGDSQEALVALNKFLSRVA